MRAPSGPVPQIPPHEAKRLVEEENALIVDVREAGEWEEGYIPGALHVPLMTIPERAATLPRDRMLILQCASGYRSQNAAIYLQRLGFERVANLQAGIHAWALAGLPLAQD